MGCMWILRSGQMPWKVRFMALTNVFACVFFLSSTVSASYICCFWFQPYFYAGYTWLLLTNRAIIVVLFINVIGNFAHCLLTDTSTRGHVPGRSYCKMCNKCNLQCPPRAHHCKLCGVCILKRDHHCFFMTTCIGYHNQRNFIMFNMHLALGALYTVVFAVKYLVSEFGVRFSGPQTFFTLFYEVLRFVMSNNVPRFRFFVSIYLMYISLLMGLMCCGFLFWQLMITSSGQTTYEAWHGIEQLGRRKNSSLQNFKSVFGKWGMFLLLFPVPLPVQKYEPEARELIHSKKKRLNKKS